MILVERHQHTSTTCLLLWRQRLWGWTHIMNQPVENLLNQTLLIDQLLLRVDFRLNLLQIPVNNCTFLQLLLFLSCRKNGKKGSIKLLKKWECKRRPCLPSSALRRCSTSRLEMRLYSLNDRRSDGLGWLPGSAWPFMPSLCPLTPSTWPLMPLTPLGMAFPAQTSAFKIN